VCLSGFLSPSPPGEEATSQDQAGQASTGYSVLAGGSKPHGGTANPPECLCEIGTVVSSQTDEEFIAGLLRARRERPRSSGKAANVPKPNSVGITSSQIRIAFGVAWLLSLRGGPNFLVLVVNRVVPAKLAIRKSDGFVIIGKRSHRLGARAHDPSCSRQYVHLQRRRVRFGMRG
jgi:hypothetical protein